MSWTCISVGSGPRWTIRSRPSCSTRSGASVNLEEVDGDDVVVRVNATPEMSRDSAKLADEIMLALASVTGEHEAVQTSAPAAEERRPRRLRG